MPSLRFGLVMALGAAGLGALPTLIALLTPPPGFTGFGTVMFVNDFAQYEAAMNAGARAPGWLVFDHFSPEPHAPAWMFPLYVAIGKVSAALGLDWGPVYRLVEVAARLALAGGLVVFALRFSNPHHRGLGVVLTLFGAGIGFWALLMQAALGVSQPYVGNNSYEVNTFALFLGVPHAAFALAAMLAAIILLAEAASWWSIGRAIVLVAVVAALGLLHPFSLAPVAGVALGLLVLTVAEGGLFSPGQGGFETGGSVRRQALPTLLVLVVAAPFVGYHWLVFGRDPFWSATYGAQNVLPSPALWELPVDLGVLVIGVVGLTPAWRTGGMPRRLAVAAAGLLLAMYVPVPFQRRLGLGVMPLLAVLATYGLAWLGREGTLPLPLGEGWGEGERGQGFPTPAASSGGLRRASLVIVLAAVSTPAVIYGAMVVSARANAPMGVYRASPDLAAARDWLVENGSPSDVVLASWDVANYLGGAIPGRTGGGHPVATLAVLERQQASQRLFADPPSQEAVLRREGALFLVSTGPQEPIFQPSAQMVFRQGDVVVVRVPW